jgi:hypothetical protein
MIYLGEHSGRKTYYLDINQNYFDLLPKSNWVCFAISNEEPNDTLLESFIRATIKKDLYHFIGQGKFGDYLHNSFDSVMVDMEVNENHPEISIMTTGSDDYDLANGFWNAYGATCLPEQADYENIKIICVSFDKIDYAMKLKNILKLFNRNWLPIDEERIKELGNEKLNIELTKLEALVFYDFIARLNQQEKKEIYEDKAEEKILWDLECLLEKQLIEPFSKNYPKLIEEARIKIGEDID